MDNEAAEAGAQKDFSLELNFVPSWARQPPAPKPLDHAEGESSEPGRERRDRGRGRDREFGRGPDRRFDRGRDRRGGRDGRGGGRGPRRRDETGGDRRGDGRGYGPREQAPERRYVERPYIRISFIPERNCLGAMVREIRGSRRAYPLFELAARLLGNPAAHLVVLETVPRDDGKPAGSLFQCKECKSLFLDKASLAGHVARAHFNLFFKAEEVQGEAPKGNFLVVARCRLSGELLGPPNHHAYNARLQELHRTRFSDMTLDEYRQNIEILRDPALIEKWKQDSQKQTVYRAVGVENAPALKKDEAERAFAEKHAPGMLSEVKRAIVASDVARKAEDAFLKALVDRAFDKEMRSPFTLSIALRPALRHMKFEFFKANGRMTFVTSIRPRALDATHTVEAIGSVLKYLHEHPGCTREAMVAELRPGVAVESPDVQALLSPLSWLIEKGHVIEFFDGTLAVPRDKAHGASAYASEASADREGRAHGVAEKAGQTGGQGSAEEKESKVEGPKSKGVGDEGQRPHAGEAAPKG